MTDTVSPGGKASHKALRTWVGVVGNRHVHFVIRRDGECESRVSEGHIRHVRIAHRDLRHVHTCAATMRSVSATTTPMHARSHVQPQPHRLDTRSRVGGHAVVGIVAPAQRIVAVLHCHGVLPWPHCTELERTAALAVSLASPVNAANRVSHTRTPVPQPRHTVAGAYHFAVRRAPAPVAG